MLFILFIYSISFVNGCNVIWDYDILGKASLEAVSCTYPCNQVPGRIYKKGGQCYLALGYCNACLENPAVSGSTHLKPVPCDPCPDCSSCGNGNICAGEETCIITHQDYCKSSGSAVDCSPYTGQPDYKTRGCDLSTGSCLVLTAKECLVPQICPHIADEATCLLGKDNRGGDLLNQPCTWCGGGACTTDNGNRCEPSEWLFEHSNKEHPDQYKTASTGLTYRSCPYILDKPTCLSTKDNRPEFIDQPCVWCDTGFCTTDKEVRCEPAAWLIAQPTTLQLNPQDYIVAAADCTLVTALFDLPDTSGRDREYHPYCIAGNSCVNECIGGWMYLGGGGDVVQHDLSMTPPSGTPGTIEYEQACIALCENNPDCWGFTDRNRCEFKNSNAAPYNLNTAMLESECSSGCMYYKCTIGAGAQPIDCVVSFGEWSLCSQPCGDGIETRTGTIETQPENGGAACPALTEEQDCNLGACPIDCVLSSFSEWSTCTKLLCGNGEQTRTRIITTQPQNGGEECDPLSETQNCNTQSCCPSGINTFNWDTMIEEHINAPSVEDLVFGVDSTDLTLNIYVELPYLGKTSADNQREAKFGTTYVIDFEDFNAHSDDIKEPGTCQNRMSSSFTGKSFNDFWTYSLEPQNTNGIGNLNTLSYPPSDKWSISMKNDGCDTIIYERSFTWQELRDCSGFNGEAFTSLIHEDNKYKLSGTMYINVVSPFWYESDFGYYRVYQLLSKPFIITVSSTINVLGSTGINLITMWIIAVYKENQESDFRLVLMTETAEYLTLTRGAPNNEIFSFTKAISNTNNIDSNIFTVSNEPEAGCLNNRDYICTQLWNIDAYDPGCTSGEGGIGTDFSGTYELGFTPQCKDTNDAHCNEFLNDHIDIRDNLLIETNLVWKDDICEPELFELQFVANMLFYINDGFVDNEDIATVYNIAGTDKNTYLYQAGVDRIYVEINTDFPENTFEIFNTELTNVLICTFPPNILPKTFKDVIDPNQNVELNDMGCFNSAKDSSLSDIVNDIYPIPANNIADFTMHTEGETNIIRFSFLIPQEVTRDTLYIHAQIEVELQEAIPRRRILLDVNTANQISHFGQQVGVTNDNKKPPINEPPINEPPINEPQLPINNPINISLKSPLVIIICSLLALILTVNICYMCYVNWYKNKTRKGKGYEKVKRIDSEFDIDSEAQMLDNQ